MKGGKVPDRLIVLPKIEDAPVKKSGIPTVRRAVSIPTARKSNPELNAIRKMMSAKYKTHPELLYLSHLVSNGVNVDKYRNEIDPNVPPKYITYEMLLNEDLEEDNVREGIEPTNKKKKELRIKWWKAWYKIMSGYYSFNESQQKGGIDSKERWFEKVKATLIKKIEKASIEITPDTLRKFARDALQVKDVRIKNDRKNATYRRMLTEGEYIDNLVDDIKVKEALEYNRDLNSLVGKLENLKLNNGVQTQEELAQAILDEMKQQPQVLTPRSKKSPKTPKTSKTPKSPTAPKSPKSSTPAQSAPHTPKKSHAQTILDIDAELYNIKQDVLRNADDIVLKHGYTTKSSFENAFLIAKHAMQTVRAAYKERLKVGKLAGDYSGILRDITYPTNGFPGLYRTNRSLYMWGMQLPHQFDRVKVLKTMLYLIEQEDINTIVDLQDCESTNVEGHPDMAKGIGCNPYDISSSEEVYRLAMNAIKPDVVQRYHRVSDYYDMSAGFPSAWDKISKIEDTKEKENSVLIHCLGGKGRTGSVLLYLYMRDRTDVRERIGKVHYGYRDISEFLCNMRELLFNESDTKEYRVYKEEASREIFKIGSRTNTVGGITVARLLRQRLNRIIFNLAKHNRVGSFYLYRRPRGGSSPNEEFNDPMEESVDWDKYDRGGYGSVEYGGWFD